MTRRNSTTRTVLAATGLVLALSAQAQDSAERWVDLADGDSNWSPPENQLRIVGLTTTDLNADLTPMNLVSTLLGPDVTVSNVTYTGIGRAAGTFGGGAGIIGFDQGIILSTGNIASAAGPNTADNTTTRNFLPGDPDLDALIPGFDTMDATALEFDFECNAVNVIQFQYVFSSEEYNEWVDAIFNDVFGFFLNGNNIALVPGGGGLAVAINNVNCGNPYDPSGASGSFCNLYINNDLDDGGGAVNTEMDGLTRVFTATSVVNPGVNHIKLAIADAGDELWDSNVFIRAQSFVCQLPRGACCDLSTMTCGEDVFQTNCQAPGEVWSVGLACADLDPPCVAPNNPPTCDAGGPYSVECAGGPTSITLDGSASSDPDLGDTITYLWSSDCPLATFGPVATEMSPTLTFDAGSTCSSQCTVFLTVTDSQGASTPCQDVVTLADTSSPVFDTFPADPTVECGQSTVPASTGEPTGSDTCGTASLTHTDVSVPGCGNTEVITRTWRIADGCGHLATQDQIITVADTTAPAFDTFPLNATVECGQSVDPSATGQPTASDNCGSATITYTDATQPGPGGTSTITRTWRVEDACGLFATANQIITVADTSGPAFDLFPADVTVECGQPTDPAATGQPSASDICGSVTLTHTDTVQPNCGATETITRIWRAEDDQGQSITRNQFITVVDTTAPTFTLAPGNATFECDGLGNMADLQPWLDGAAGTDGCGTVSIASNFVGLSDGCGQTGAATVIWTLSDECQNSTLHTATVAVSDTTPPDITCPPDVTLQFGGTPDPQETGFATATDVCDSAPIVTFSDVESGPSPTIITRTWVATDACGQSSSCAQTIAGERDHPGWNWADNVIRLTGDETTYWSASTGRPKGVSPLSVLDGGPPPGRPDPEVPGQRVLRGYVLVWAVDDLGREVHWNHLDGEALVVDYQDGAAWQYDAWTFLATDVVAHGELLPDPGQLVLDNSEFVGCYDKLLFDFLAVGGVASSGVQWVTVDTDLTLLPVDLDVRRNTLGPVTTTAVFEIWNANEAKFSGAQRCITCWDQTLLADYGTTHFLRGSLQTDNGVARIDGVATVGCADSVDAALLGVAMKRLVFNDGRAVAQSGLNLAGMGIQSALIQVDIDEIPPERGTTPPPTDGPSLRRSAGVNQLAMTSGGVKRAATPVVSTNKGSLLIYSAVEVRWDADGKVIQDTFLGLTNDYPGNVLVKLFLVNGDAPLAAQ